MKRDIHITLDTFKKQITFIFSKDYKFQMPKQRFFIKNYIFNLIIFFHTEGLIGRNNVYKYVISKLFTDY